MRARTRTHTPARARAQLRLIQDEIRREEEALWAVRRDELRQRAESEQAARSSYYGLRAQERDRQLAEVREGMRPAAGGGEA
jgi:hypothetical protein